MARMRDADAGQPGLRLVGSDSDEARTPSRPMTVMEIIREEACFFAHRLDDRKAGLSPADALLLDGLARQVLAVAVGGA